MPVLSAIAAFALSTVMRPEDPPEIEVQPTVIEREIEFQGAPVFSNGAAVKLVGTLTLPTHYDTPHPAVLLVSGAAGPTGRSPSAPILNDLMKEIAHHLATKGFASFRYEHRTSPRYDDQFPIRDLSVMSLGWDYAKHRSDATAAFRTLRMQPEILRDQRPLILGHYVGGIIALDLAVPQSPAGLILLSTPGRNFSESIGWTYRNMVESSSRSSEEKAAILADMGPTFRTIEEHNDRLWSSHPFWQEVFPRQSIGFFHGLFRNRHMRRSLAFKGPVLVAQGDKDDMADADVDAPAIASQFNNVDTLKSTLWVIPDANHFFRKHVDGGTLGRLGPILPELFTGIDNFLDQHFPREP